MTPGIATSAAIAEIVRLLRPLVLHLARAREGPLAGTGLTPATRALVEILAEEGPRTVPDIARHWTLGRQNVQRSVDTLAELAFVERVRNPGHRKSALVSLTPKGVAVFRDVHRREQEVIARLTTGLAQADVETCRRVLAHLQAGFQFSARGGGGRDDGIA